MRAVLWSTWYKQKDLEEVQFYNKHMGGGSG